jgi:hypothetical protein
MMENGTNWLFCQVNAITKYAGGPACEDEDFRKLRDLSTALQKASASIERALERRVEKYIAESRRS